MNKRELTPEARAALGWTEPDPEVIHRGDLEPAFSRAKAAYWGARHDGKTENEALAEAIEVATRGY